MLLWLLEMYTFTVENEKRRKTVFVFAYVVFFMLGGTSRGLSQLREPHQEPAADMHVCIPVHLPNLPGAFKLFQQLFSINLTMNEIQHIVVGRHKRLPRIVGRIGILESNLCVQVYCLMDMKAAT